MPLVRAVDEAERRGDAEEALRLMASHPQPAGFWRPRRRTCLMQVSVLGDIAPRWVVSRWVLAQAVQHFGDPTSAVAGRRLRRALDVAIELRGGSDRLPGRDHVDRHCRVMDHDWVFRELFLHDLGGLRHFLDRVASPDLIAKADRVDEWAGRPMGGYRFTGSDPALATWVDLADEAPVVTANIGSAAVLRPGDCVLGRLVPIGEDEAMFASAPLRVPLPVATAVSRDPDAWVDALRVAPPGLSLAGALPCSGLVSDVPDVFLEEALVAVAARPVEQLSDRRVVAHLVLELARRVAAGASPRVEDPDPWACLSGVLMEPGVMHALALRCDSRLASAERALLRQLGAQLAEPVAAWCRALARTQRDAV